MVVRGGWMGRVLRVDLASREVTDFPWTDRDRAMWLGGKAMGARILADLLRPGIDPLGAENAMVISTGPLTATGAPSSGRFSVSSLSPLNGLVVASNCGGPLGTYLKRAGVDALVLVGRSSSRVWLEVRDEGVVFHDATAMWGLGTSAATEAIESRIGHRGGTLVIGPAGENGVPFACAISGRRAAGRAGMGAVLGSKNVKGIAAWGTHRIPVAHPARYHRHLKRWVSSLKAHPVAGGTLARLGTGGLLQPMQELGILATRNFQAGRFAGAERIGGEALAAGRLVATRGCMSCPVRCERVVEQDGEQVKGPELETMVLFGSNIANDDLDRIIEWNRLLDELGLDTMSVGVTIAYAMEAAERGLWDNGLAFGETGGISGLIEDIAYRRGLGAELAEGTRTLAERYGGASFAMHARGMELAAYEPRSAVGQGLGYAVSNRGGCHLNAGYAVALEGVVLRMHGRSTRSKAALTAFFQDLMDAVSSTGVCLFTTLGVLPASLVRTSKRGAGAAAARLFEYSSGLIWLLRFLPRALLRVPMPMLPHIRALELATGVRFGLGDFWSIGERTYTLERVLALRFSRPGSADTLPGRLLDEPIEPDDPRSVVPLAKLVRHYYGHRGWDAEGRPTRALLKRLGIPSE